MVVARTYKPAGQPEQRPLVETNRFSRQIAFDGKRHPAAMRGRMPILSKFVRLEIAPNEDVCDLVLRRWLHESKIVQRNDWPTLESWRFAGCFFDF